MSKNLVRNDKNEVLTNLKISQQNGIDVHTVIGDAAYSGKNNLKLTHEQGGLPSKYGTIFLSHFFNKSSQIHFLF